MIFNSTKFNIDWPERGLSSLGTFRRGKSKHRPRNDPKLFKNGTYPLIQTGEVKKAHLYINSHKASYNEFGLTQSQIWPKNTMCITIAANIAETGILGYPMCFPDSVVGFNANQNKTSELFMHYVFSYIRNAIQKTASGSIQDNINIDFLKDLVLKIPPKKTQESICNVLKNIDKKIELNNEINSELEALAKLIYDYWFVQFDFPDDNGKPYKSSGGKMIYNEDLKREIPVGWSAGRLSEFEPKIITGKTPSTNDKKNFEGNIPFICIGDVRGNMHVTKTDITLTEVGAASQANKFIPKGAICVTCIASPGHVAFATSESQTNQQLNSVVCKRDENRYFLYFYLKDYFNFAKAKTGNTFANMNKDDFSSIQLLYPKNEIVDSFSENVKSVFDLVLLNSQENNLLIELRDFLLPMFMNGQLTFYE